MCVCVCVCVCVCGFFFVLVLFFVFICLFICSSSGSSNYVALRTMCPHAFMARVLPVCRLAVRVEFVRRAVALTVLAIIAVV